MVVSLTLDLFSFGLMALIVTGAYMVFGMTGFGATIVAMPILVQFQPLALAVPIMLLLDMAATLSVGGRNWRTIEKSELKRLVPPMLAGIVLGATALHRLPAQTLLMCLGVFVTANALWSLRSVNSPATTIGPRWALPAGVVGGVFGAAFGTGGPVYTIYLVRRLANIGVFRATIAAVILASAVLRTLVFGAAGLLSDPTLLTTVAALLPFCLLGVFTGSSLRHKIAPDRLRKLILGLLLMGGLAVMARAMRP